MSKWARGFADIIGVVGGELTEEEAGLRRLAFTSRDDNAGIGVSTAWMPDEECYETAIFDGTQLGRVYIVERYSDEAVARKGHDRWAGIAKPGAVVFCLSKHADVTLDPSRPDGRSTVEVPCPRCGVNHPVLVGMVEIDKRCGRCHMDSIMGRDDGAWRAKKT